MFSIKIITLFPNEVLAFFNKGILKRAFEKRLFSFEVIDLRTFAVGKHQKVDDYPFSHKKGMLLRSDVLYNAITSIDLVEEYRLLYTCPSGVCFNQSLAKTYLEESNKGIIICSGYYEGIDDRLQHVLPVEPISIGDYVLMSGDLPALVVTETVLRQVPGVLGNQLCVEDDSIFNGTLEHPQFTKPDEWKGISIPAVLKSGDHEKVRNWKRKESLKKTLFKRPDLLASARLDDTDRVMLTAIIKETLQGAEKNDR